jgi:hypothetical protein
MADVFDFADNLILHMEREKRSLKFYTTEERDNFKIVNGLWNGDSVIDTKFCNLRELKQYLIDSVVNGYEIKLNMAFKQGLLGVAKELAAERVEQLKQEESTTCCAAVEEDCCVQLVIEEDEIIEEINEKNC